MNVLLLTIASVLALYGLISVVLWLRYMKTIRLFEVTDCLNDEAIYSKLSVIVPACNEEECIEQTVRQLITQDYQNLEIVIVNDRSTDNTGAILEKLLIQFPQLKVVTIYDLPSNWLGKNHAIDQGVKHATGEWLLLTDADVMFSPRSLKKTVSYALEHSLDHLTIVPDVFYGGVFYRAFLAYFGLTFFSIAMVTHKAGLGAFNLVKTSVYQEIGGYEAIALHPLDDMSFGKQIVEKGYKQGLACSGKGFIMVKWYESLFDILRGFEKNQFSSMNYRVSAVIGLCIYSLLTNVYPFAGLFFGPLSARILCGISVLSLFVAYNHLSKLMDISRGYFLLHPLSALLFLGAMLNSMVKIINRGGIKWRGTFYPLEVLKKHI
ncbi:glycosyltransferase [Desulfosporosinus meridiei]|uniref:4,4'-diaponeurosporenoate glycosyltransferase n=1 Tax=Desulfosporosinus meridiei (strain ATCC BAA-275 / DSM 13257 / KCTC 12902 / NCIMB 13706 / S10) TaxID=768704 RepID=J7IW14_DESMD|nr:glycosyltransferase family 2 protein [Desulfosporosinus meridiei]AFQ43288.1 glycosyl transferase [Desulfosporosinus meridiei DSM 13257]